MNVVLDTSAVMAVLLGEPDAEAYAAVMEAEAGALLMCAATRVELGIVVEARFGDSAATDVEELLSAVAVEVVPLDADRARVALAAWRRFGKGRHPAGLNLGDCYSYSLASVTGGRLLYKGRDFDQTDVRRVDLPG